VARRRFPLIELVLIPAAVQGAGAPGQIVAAIQQMCTLESIDVMIVGRGGGSPEDLAPFNHESVARAIYASTVPVVSAVGHETDISIADLVADVRAATPSAAAEIILPDMQELLTDLDDYRGAMIDSIERRLADEQSGLDRLQRRLALQSPELRIERTRHELDVLRRRMATAARADVRRRGTSLGTTAKLLDALHPVRVMQRGFAMVEGPDRKPISRVADLPADGAVVVNFRDGAAAGSLTAIDTSPPAERHESEQT
jgi:exodeoxyribonuclease VII large subunit